MGNRGIITLENRHGVTHPVALYLHWNGGLESVLAFVTFTANTFERGHDDMFTFHARLCQVIGNFFPDGLSLYGLPVSAATDWSTQNGVFHFRLDLKGPTLVGREGEVARAKSHPYWTDPHTIFDTIRAGMPGRDSKYQPQGGLWNTRTENNPLMALERLGACWPEADLTTRTDDERVAFYIRITEVWNAEAAPLLQAHAAGMPPKQEVVT